MDFKVIYKPLYQRAPMVDQLSHKDIDYPVQMGNTDLTKTLLTAEVQ